MKFINILLVGLLLVAQYAVSEESILNRASNITSKLEVLSNLGQSCEAQLQVNGMNGASSPECEKYLKNIQGEYFTSLGKECVALSNWYEEKRKFIIANSNYAETNPREAKQLVTEMKAVNKACLPENMASYTYLTKPLDTIKALSELK